MKGGGRRGWVCCCCVGGCSVVEDMFFLWGSLCAKGSVCLIPIVRSSDSETAGFLCSRRLGAQVGVVGCVKWWIGLGCGCQKVDSIHQIEFLTDAVSICKSPTIVTITPPCPPSQNPNHVLSPYQSVSTQSDVDLHAVVSTTLVSQTHHFTNETPPNPKQPIQVSHLHKQYYYHRPQYIKTTPAPVR